MAAKAKATKIPSQEVPARSDISAEMKNARLEIEYRDAKSLAPYKGNARTHSPEQVDKIVRSIREFGWTNPVLVDGANGVIAGHGRLLAAKKLGLAQVPCIELAGLSEAQKRALIIADNQLAISGAGWDNELLKIEFGALAALDFDLELTGFSLDEVAALTADKTAGLTDPDEAPEAPAAPVTEYGDVWLLGSHRLVCGDSTSAESVALALNGVKPHLCVTDPPYGVEYDADWRNQRFRADGTPSDGRAIGLVKNDDQADWRDAFALFPGDVIYSWHADLRANSVFDSLVASGFQIRAQIIWAKQQFAIGRGDYHFQHEPCWYAVRKGKTGHWASDRKQTTLWQIDKPQKSETGHSTQKPVECMKRPIENNSSPGQAVYEPFAGSSTTIIAGEMTGRHVHAIELSPAYVDVGVTRWQNFTGKFATLEATGETFVETMARRQPNAKITASAGSHTSATKTAQRAKPKGGSSQPNSELTTGSIPS